MAKWVHFIFIFLIINIRSRFFLADLAKTKCKILPKKKKKDKQTLPKNCQVNVGLTFLQSGLDK
jgi:hypothetical protein